MFGQFLIRYRIALLLGVLALTAFSATRLREVVVNQDLSKDYARGNDDYRFFRYMTDRLGDEHDFLYIGLRRNAGIFDSTFLLETARLTAACDSLPEVIETQSIANMTDVYLTMFGLIGFPFVTHENVANFSNDSLAMVGDDRLMDRFVSRDFKTIVITLKLQPGISSVDSEKLIGRLEALLANAPFEEKHLAGHKYYQASYNREANKEMKRGMLVSILTLILVLGWLYRSFWAVLIPLLVYVMGVVNYLGYHAIVGHPLTAASNMFPVILLIATLSDILHILGNYEAERAREPDRRLAIIAAFNRSRIPTFLTSFLVALGFWTFISSPIPNFQVFGLAMGVGIMICYLVTMSVLPLALYRMPAKSVTANAYYHRNWEKTADWIAGVVMHRGKWVAGIALAILLTGTLTIQRIPRNVTMFGAWRNDHPVERSNRFFEKNLVGIRPLEIALTPASGRTLGQLPVLKEIEKVHQYLDSLPNVGGVFSPVSYFKSFHKILDIQHKAFFLPATQDSLEADERTVQEETDFKYRRILTEDKTFGKISARMHDPGRLEVAKLNRQIETWIGSHVDTTLVHFRLTGSAFMQDIGHVAAIDNTFSSLWLSFAVIGLVLLLVFRSWLIVGITLVVNITPIFITLTMMAAMGIMLKLATTIIFNVVFVLALDDTVHFMSRYQKERSGGLSPDDAIRLILRESAKAMVLTTLLVVAGYTSLLFSNLQTVFALGALVCVTSLGALLTDLFLSPWLLRHLDKSAP